jgi:hypothetical protein
VTPSPEVFDDYFESHQFISLGGRLRADILGVHSLNDSMQSRRSYPLIAWLCLIWFGLTNTVLAGGMVVCRDGHGGMAIEWGCDRNAGGECLTACGDATEEDDLPVPHPCEDTPVPSDLQVTKAPPRATGELTVPIPVLVAVLVVWADISQPDAAMCGCSNKLERPPDVLKHIRTVVLVV